MKLIYKKAVIGAWWVLCAIGIATAQEQSLPPGFDEYVGRVLQAFEVPGISVGIVKDGKVVLAKGYGVKKLGDPDPVDEHTLFNIASNSKAFTGTALAMLVEEGKLDWEDPVIKYLPYLQFSDDYVTAHLTVRDLLVHHSGLPAYANDFLLFPPSTYSRKELLKKLKDVPLRYDFRSVYAYDNILYVAAGEVVEAVSGMSWEDFVKTRIFDRVGMKNSISRYSTLKDQPNVAYAHARRNGKVEVRERYFETNIGDNGNPAGGIASSAADMSRWLITQLDSGRTPDGFRIFKPSTTEQLWKIVRPMPISKEPEWLKPNQKNFWGYALGFRTYDYRGVKVVGHGGLLTGFVSQIAMVPDKKLGVVVLTNQLSSGAYWSIINHVVDHYLGNEPFDWIAGYKKELDRSLSRQDSTRARSKPVLPDTTWRRALPLADYAGAYRDPLLGRGVISVVSDTALRLDFPKAPQYSGKLRHFHGDQFRLVYDNSERGEGPFLTFVFNADKSIREGRFVTEREGGGGNWTDIVLTPDKGAVLDTADLRKRIGQIMKRHPKGRFAYALLDMQNGEQLLYNAGETFHAASTMKTPVMIEVFRQAAAGKFRMTDSITVYNEFRSIVDRSRYSLPANTDSEGDLYARIGTKLTRHDLVYRMITESSNLATNILIDQVGAKSVMKTMKTMGANDIQVLRGVEDTKAFEKGLNNTVTAYDLMLLFKHLAAGTAVDRASSEAMVDILKAQRFRSMIPARLPDDVVVAHKTGSITEILHDSGIVYLPDGRAYVLVLLSGGLPDDDARNALASISRLVYDYMSEKE
ncbi:CubicO group peptidase, beta-lactamase class C family [Parapedobacter composti]|uniref:CubicO group peptidase, beta-lactamase class C family n=1 Tax=Parapedobacter composti TaxID=623281 RepID=A0A1I1KP95_9SPHI|nr:serine hydrolase [Parapedobacter composti]SFC59260.1 CubicO group peptidase, beta-lactamase class C family [Parapedobacter composti]